MLSNVGRLAIAEDVVDDTIEDMVVVNGQERSVCAASLKVFLFVQAKFSSCASVQKTSGC